MSAFILPVGFIHWTLTIRHVSIPRPMLVTGAAEIETPPFSLVSAGLFHIDLVDALKPVYDAEWTFPELVVLVGQDGDPGRLVTTNSTVGTRASQESPPPQVTYLITKNTQLSGRRNRGRMYLPASNEAGINQNGGLAAGEITVLNTMATALQAAQVPAGGNNLQEPVILHSQAPSTPTPVISHNVGAFVATQRRRLVRTA